MPVTLPGSQSKDAGAEANPAAVSMPPNILIEKDFQPVVAKLLSLSPTFRRQFERIGGTSDLRVTINLVTPRAAPTYRARCLIAKAQGMAIVQMQIVALTSYPEVVGHEFEHLLEQLDGLDLPELAHKKGSGVVRQSDGSFETRRAITAGKTVAHEYLTSLRGR